ncbi:MAG: hypothetical protein ACK4YP_02540, partial [Myxococcota bacterium]
TGEDTGDTGEDTGFAWEDTDDTCDGRWPAMDIGAWDEGGGCGWAFLWGRNADEAFQLDPGFDPASVDDGVDVLHERDFGDGATLEVIALDGGGTGGEFWSCSDYIELLEGTLWQAVSGTVRVEARYVCTFDDPYCGDDEYEYHAVVWLTDVVLRAPDGTERAWPDTDLRVLLGTDECGG